MSGRGRPVIPLSLKEGEELRSITGYRTLPHGKVQRAQVVPGCAEGESQGLIAKRLGLSPVTVGKWCRRYQDRGLEGLQNEQPPGRPRSYDDERMAEVALQVGRPMAAIGVSVHWQRRWVFPSSRSIASSSCFISNPIGNVISRFPTILCLWIRCMTLQVCT